MLKLTTHQVIKGVGRREVASYVMLNADGQPAIYLQEGKAYFSDGSPVNDLAPYQGEISKLSESGKAAAGWEGKRRRGSPVLPEEARVVGIGDA